MAQVTRAPLASTAGSTPEHVREHTSEVAVMPWSELSPTVKALALAGRIKKEAFDVFPPHGLGLLDGVESVALNPQPLPPRDPLVVGALHMSRRLVQMAVEARVRGEEPQGWLEQLVDEWCGTPWPRRWPWPGPGPAPEGGPVPDPWRVAEARAAGAVVFASAAASLGHDELQDVLARSAERLADAAGQEV